MTKWPLELAAREFACNSRTLSTSLRRMGHEVKPGMKWSARDIAAALYGDYKSEKARLTKAQADLAEQEARQQSGELILRVDAERLIANSLQPIREALVSAPSTLAARANPSDPTVARLAVRAWVEETLRVARETITGNGHVEKPKRGRPKEKK